MRMRSSSTRSPSSALLLLSLFALLSSLPGAWQAGAGEDQEIVPLFRDPAPVIDIDPGVVEGWETHECAACHRTVAEEWAHSAHGLAWVDEDYRKSLKGKRRPRSCYGCHIPEPLFASGSLTDRVRPRDPKGDDAHRGVDCISCHVDDQGRVLGPWGVETDAHVSVRSDHHRTAPPPGEVDGGADAALTATSDDLCASCHATTIGPVIGLVDGYRAAGMPERGLSCVGCHMARTERRWANAPAGAGEDEAIPLRFGRSHALQTPRDPYFLSLAFGWDLRGEAGARTLVLRNQAGHRVPGLVGRVLEFELTSRSADGEELGTQALRIDSNAFLTATGERSFELDPAADSVEIVGLHTSPRQKKPVEFLRRRIEIVD